jgi:diguanylate cyclase (GGDEF)-like protein
VWRDLLRDPIVRLLGLVLALSIAPYFLQGLGIPGLSVATVSHWAAYYSSIPLLVVAIVACRYRLGRISDRIERRFWNFWSLSMGAWLLQSLYAAARIRFAPGAIRAELVDNGLFALFYLFAALALEVRPDEPESPLARALHAVERGGTFIFFLGLLLYFAVLPALLAPDDYAASSVLLYVALDGYLIIRLVGLLRRVREPLWRRVYSWLLITTLLWLATDSVETLMWTGALPLLPDGTLWDLGWFPAFGTFVVAARVREVPAPSATDSRPLRRLEYGPLVLYAVSFPLIHFGLVRLGWLEPELTPAYEALALVLLVALATTVVLHQRLLRQRNRLLEQEREAAQRRIEHLAFHDELTDLPNRRLLNDRLNLGLARAHRHQWKLGVLLLDLDDFKAVNDTHGHSAGDEVLLQLARRLQWFVREGDTVARLGGDEFVALLEGLRSEPDAVRVAEQLAEILAAPFDLDNQSLTVATSIGWAVFPDHGDTPEALLEAADRSMYRRKQGPSRRLQA